MRHSGFNASHEAPAGLDDIPTRQKGATLYREHAAWAGGGGEGEGFYGI
ncbi:hypothetical protein VD0002_g7805 [Verticillium dahliae]|uniref:Uncharacterized protein n=1 Tax=Verticillium dahliae TaxID=27337 RepID=A0AA45AJ47_VERDA|nr:hypothetical protein BJF96_g7995 [Verticillium dahliae]PNH45862.1 hypothetical protein VD0004_g2099 [Verticillium dahliae]PNH49634.1 hypothetical protein VD0003_g7508 [Verticillium dahliae]PNH59768.1 hypothetical protein VD0002_g7805 [Verticillium dahliae]